MGNTYVFSYLKDLNLLGPLVHQTIFFNKQNICTDVCVFFEYRKESGNGFDKSFTIKCNKNKDGCRTNNIEIKGTCCWEIFDRSGNDQEFTPGQDKEPNIAYISKLKTKKCV